jgi:hypothetical protein
MTLKTAVDRYNNNQPFENKTDILHRALIFRVSRTLNTIQLRFLG